MSEAMPVPRSRSLFRTSDASSSSLLAKSAPPTPQGDRLLQPAPPPLRHTPAAAPPRSPGHSFGRHDRQTLKQLSASVPAMTQAQPAISPSSEPLVAGAATLSASPGPQDADATPTATAAAAAASAATPVGSSKSRQKKFHRHFKTVAPEEHVVNYYSCALVGDILLQGHLYITKNYFAFYSNVFGYVTKLLIPTVSVLKVSKEKTARIIPNAIGVTTGLEKHVFGSLLSRDSTYKLMVQVWKEAMSKGPKIPLPVQVIKSEVDSVSGDLNLPEDEDSSLSGSEHSCPPMPFDCPTDMSHSEVGEGDIASVATATKLPNGNLAGVKHIQLPLQDSSVAMPRPTYILLVCTGLLVLLFLSATFLLYRIGKVQNQFAENPLLMGSDEVYKEILKWQTQLHSRSANEVQEFLNTNLNQLAKVRQSLEALSLLIVTEEQHLQQQQRHKKETKTSQQQSPSSLPHDRHS